MNIWHALIALWLFVSVMKAYTWLQVRYWCSPDCKDGWGLHKNKMNSAGVDQASSEATKNV